MTTMKAIVKVRGEPNGTEMMDVPVPRPGPHEILIKNKAVSICGTDVHIFNWDPWSQGRIKPPLIYGHEFAGDIVEVGSEVKNVKVGAYVSGECHVACGHCYQCKNGGMHVCQNLKLFGADLPGIFAEYAVIPAENAWLNDHFIAPEFCSIQDPFGNAVHSVTSTDVVGKDVLVLGVGPIGAMCISLCKRMGAKRVFAIETKEYRRELAKQVGVDFIYEPGEHVHKDVMDKTEGKGVDVILEMSGSGDALNAGIDMMRTGGEVILLGVFGRPVTIDLSNKVVFKYATLKGIYGRRMWGDWHKMKDLLKNADIRADLSKIITHKMPFADFLKGMDIMRSGNSGKVVLTF